MFCKKNPLTGEITNTELRIGGGLAVCVAAISVCEVEVGEKPPNIILGILNWGDLFMLLGP